MFYFECFHLTISSRIQGVIRREVFVAGTMTMERLNDSVQKALDADYRIVAPIRLSVKGSSGTGSGYHRFCNEFTEKRRCVACEISEKVTFNGFCGPFA